MKKIKLLILAGVSLLSFAACKPAERNTEPLVDPWTRERTPVNFRLESQIGAAVITGDWRHDETGKINVSLITGALDMSAVKVVALDFKFPESEFCPKSSIKAGDTIDLSSGSASFTVTAYNGETRTYTVTYDQFKDPLEGCYVHDPIGGILDGSAPMCSAIVIGGWTDAVVLSTLMDKWWHWEGDYSCTLEQDNTLSFLLTKADSETGQTFGTLVNTPGDDGKYTNYMYNGSRDVNDKFRIFPVGSSRWSKDGTGNITIYDKDDEEYQNPLYVVVPVSAGAHSYAGKDINVPSYAFMIDHKLTPDQEVIDYNWPDTRWMADNVRYSFWYVKKTSDEPLANHAELF